LDAFITFVKEKGISPKLLKAVREINQTMNRDENAALNIVRGDRRFIPDGFAVEAMAKEPLRRHPFSRCEPVSYRRKNDNKRKS